MISNGRNKKNCQQKKLPTNALAIYFNSVFFNVPIIHFLPVYEFVSFRSMIQFTVQLFHPIFSDNAFSRVFQNLLNSQETEDQIFLPWSQKAMAAPAESHHLRSQLTFTKATLHAEHDAVNITSVSKTWRKFRVDHREFLEAGAKVLQLKRVSWN